MSLTSPISRHLLKLLLLAAIIGTSAAFFTAAGQQTIRREIVFPVPIQWANQKGVTRYRLQIATDERFQDVFFDGRIVGSKYLASNLSPGYYYWRVAAADAQSPEFSRPVRFFVSGGVVKTARLPNRRAHARQPATIIGRR